MKSDGSTAHFKNERPWENSDFLISQSHTQSKHNEVKAFITCISKNFVRLICGMYFINDFIPLCHCVKAKKIFWWSTTRFANKGMI